MAFGDKVQENGGSGSGPTSFNATLPGAITAGNMVVIDVVADNVPGGANTGWTKSTGMSPVANAQGMLWWFLATGGDTIPTVTFGGAAKYAWRIVEYAGPFDATPYETSAGAATNGIVDPGITSSSITPTAAGNYLIVAGLGGQDAGDVWNITGPVTLGSFTNSFVNDSQQFRQASVDAHIACQVSRVVTGASGSYSTTGTISHPTISGSSCRVGMTIAFKRGAGGTDVDVDVTGDAMTSSVGDVSVTTTGGISVNVTGDPITASAGTASVSTTAGTIVNITAPFQKTISVGDVSVTTQYIVAGPQFAVANEWGGSYVIDQQARDWNALGTYFAKPSAASNTYAIVTGNAMTASTATSSVGTGQRISVTGDAMTIATNPVTVTVPLAAPVFSTVTNTSYQDRAGLTTIIKPDTQLNDILLAAVFMGASADPGDITPPPGFNAIAASTVVSAGGFDGRFQVFWKRAGESEPTSYDFEHPGVTASTQIVMEAFSGCSVLSSPIVAVSRASGTGTTSTATAITTTDDSSGLVFAGHCWAGAGATPPTGFAERFDFVVTISDDDKPTAGSTGSIVSTPNGNSGGGEPWQAWLIGLKPVAPVSGGTVYVQVSSTQMAALVSDANVGAGVTYPPPFRSISSTTYASRTNTVLPKPVNVAERDIILAGMFWGGLGDPGDAAVVPPEGWQGLSSESTVVNYGSFHGRFRVFWKRATYSEPSSYTFTHAALSTQIVGMAYSRARESTNPVEVMSISSGVGLTSNAASITTLTDNDTLIVFGHNWAAGGTAGPPAGWTERFDNLVTASETPFLTKGPTGIISYTSGNTAADNPWQSWLLALKPSGTGETASEVTASAMTAYVGSVIVEYDSAVYPTGTPMTMSLGIANVRHNGGMRVDVTGTLMVADVGSVALDIGDVYLAQKAEGTSLMTNTTTVSLPFAPKAGQLIFLGLATNDYNLEPDDGWIQAAGMGQETWNGAYGWYRIADGVASSWQYTIESATNSAWLLTAWANIDDLSPYDVSAGNIGENTGISHTTPAIVPSLGTRLEIAVITGMFPSNLSAASFAGWTNGYTAIDTIGSNYPGSNNIVGMAYKVETTSGVTSTSTGATLSPDTTLTYKRVGLIIAFKKMITKAQVTAPAMTMSVGTVEVQADQNILVAATSMQSIVGGFSVTDGVGVNIILGSETMTAETGSALVPLYSGWDIATIAGAALLTNSDRTLTQTALLPSTAISCIEHDEALHYVEVTIGGSTPSGHVGLYDPVTNNGTRIVLETGQILKSPANTLVSMFPRILPGDTIGIAYDGDIGQVWFRVNGGLWNNDPLQSPAPANIPLSFDDARFAENEEVGWIGITSGTVQNKTIYETGHTASILCYGTVAVDTTRIFSRECIRVTSGIDITNCYLEALGEFPDHADTIQCYSPTQKGGILNVTDTAVVAHNQEATAGILVGDNWSGTVTLRNTMFKEGPYGLRVTADAAGCVINLSLTDVYFVGPFNFGRYAIFTANGGVLNVTRWENVRDATIVNGVLVPGALVAPPVANVPTADNILKQNPAIYYPVYASITNNSLYATATINTGVEAFAAEKPQGYSEWASPNTYVDVTGVSMQAVQGGFSLSVTASGATSTTLYMGTGPLLTAAIGEESVTATTGAQCFVTGNSMTIWAGIVDVPFSEGLLVAVTGEPMTIEAGSVVQGVSVTGVEMAASVGTVGVPQPVFVNVTGDPITASAGTITLRQGQAINVTGNLMVLEMGAVFVSLPGQAGLSTDVREGRMLDMANWMGN